MKHQRSHSYHADFHQLTVEERRLARNAMRAFSEAMASAGDGKPKFPEWMHVRRTPYSKSIWQIRWDVFGVAGRATFTLVRISGELCVRWLRISAPRSAQAVPAAAKALDELVLKPDRATVDPAVHREAEATQASLGQEDGERGPRVLPQSADLIAFTLNIRGERIYLERDRWIHHIMPNHVTRSPEVRGKTTTTWWPVVHSATGYRSMTEEQVVDLIMDAARLGHWQNAPRGTRLAVYHPPHEVAQVLGVSEVKVSTAPDGRILSAYPTAGSNVLAVKELAPEELERHDAVPFYASDSDASSSTAASTLASSTGWDG